MFFAWNIAKRLIFCFMLCAALAGKFNKPTPVKSECQQESSKIRNKRQKCENPNLFKLRLLVVHIELLIDMWLTFRKKIFVLAENGDTRFQGQTCEN